MLRLNVPRVMALRGIKHPYTFLRERGFSHHMAVKLGTDNVPQIDLAILGKLCTLLHCTPHDLLDTVETQNTTDIQRHHLGFLQKSTAGDQFHKTLRTMPLDQVERFAQGSH